MILEAHGVGKMPVPLVAGHPSLSEMHGGWGEQASKEASSLRLSHLSRNPFYKRGISIVWS